MIPKVSSPTLRLTFAVCLAFLAVFWLTPPPPAEAIFPLAYSWSCTSRYCSFSVTTSNHGAYAWGFGDGTSAGKSTSTTVYHFYDIPVDEDFHNFDVNLVGYATMSSGSPDNIIGCTITVAASNLGIGTGGSC
jgi:hypothetical protein